MAFTVETGAVVANANAYITVQFFRDWFVDRGVAAAANDTGVFGAANIQAAIVKATDYVDKRFGTKFKGMKTERGQSLQWPRYNAEDNSCFLYPSDEIPTPLKRAVAEYANLALYMVLLPVPAPSFNVVDPATGETTVSTGGLLQRHREKVAVIETDDWYNADQWRLVLNGRAPAVFSSMVSTVNLPEYPVADEWLKEIVKFGQGTKLARGD